MKPGQISLICTLRRVDRDGVCGSNICVPIGPPETDETLSVTLAEGYHDTIFSQRINIFADAVRWKIGREPLYIIRVDDFQEGRCRDVDGRLLPQQCREKRKKSCVRLRGMRTVI